MAVITPYDEDIKIVFSWKRLPLFINIIISFIIVFIIYILDEITVPEMSFSLFYLIPISFATIFGNFKTGIFFSIVSALAWLMGDYLTHAEYSHSLIPIWNMLIRFGYFSLHTFFLSQLLTLYRQSKSASFTDPLTNLANWRLFKKMFEKEVSKNNRILEPISLMYIDLDNFKQLNDNFGHSEGDRLLKHISDKMIHLLRQGDTVARLGGDEFIVLLPNTESKEAIEIVQRLQKRILESFQQNNWNVTLSIGAMTYTHFNLTIDEMIKEVDNLMYLAKKNGKNQYIHRIYPQVSLSP